MFNDKQVRVYSEHLLVRPKILGSLVIVLSHKDIRDLHRRAAYSFCESSFFIHHGIYHYLFVCP